MFPGTGWLVLIWENFHMMHERLLTDEKIVFEDVKFLRATSLQLDQDIKITLSIHRGLLML